MVKTGGNLGFDPSRIKFNSREEVRVGAFARRQRRQRLLVGAVGVGLIAAAVWMYVELRPSLTPENPNRYPVAVRCDVCGHVQEIRVPFGQTFPTKCEECGGLACRPLWRCRNCDETFAPEKVGGTVQCPKCGSLEVGSATSP